MKSIKQLIKTIILILPILYSSFSFSDYSIEKNPALSDPDFYESRILFNSVDEALKDDIVRFYCAAYGPIGCSSYVSYSTTEGVADQIAKMSREELDQLLSSSGGLQDYVAIAVNTVQADAIRQLVIFLFVCSLFFAIYRYASGVDYKKLAIFYVVINLSVSSIILHSIITARNNQSVSYIVQGFLFTQGMVGNFANQLYYFKFDNTKIFVNTIKVPFYGAKEQEITEITDFIMCVSSVGGTSLNLNFSQISNDTIRTSASYKTCALKMDFGIDSVIDNEAKLFNLSKKNMGQYQVEKIKSSITELFRNSLGVVGATITALNTNDNSRTIFTLGTAQKPQTRKDAYVYYTDVQSSLSKSFIRSFSDVTPSPSLVGNEAELCESIQHSAGRPYFRPGAAQSQIAECVAKACEQSLYACTSALYLEKELKIFGELRSRGFYNAPTLFIKNQITINKTPRNFANKMSASFNLASVGDSEKAPNTDAALFNVSLAVPSYGDFDFDEFMEFRRKRQDEYDKLFPTPNYTIDEVLAGSADKGILGVKKFNTCMRFENQLSYTNGFSCGTGLQETEQFGLNMLGFVTQLNLSFYNSKILNAQASKYLEPKNTITKNLAKNFATQFAGGYMMSKAIETDVSTDIYAESDGSTIFKSNQLAITVANLALNEETNSNIIDKVNSVFVPLGFTLANMSNIVYLIMQFAFNLCIATVHIFTLTFPFFIIMYAKVANENHELSLIKIFGLVVEKCAEVVGLVLGFVIMTDFVMTIIFSQIRADDINELFNTSSTFDSTFVGYAQTLMYYFVVVFFMIFFISKNMNEAGKTPRRIANNIAGKFEYEVEDVEVDILKTAKDLK